LEGRGRRGVGGGRGRGKDPALGAGSYRRLRPFFGAIREELLGLDVVGHRVQQLPPRSQLKVPESGVVSGDVCRGPSPCCRRQQPPHPGLLLLNSCQLDVHLTGEVPVVVVVVPNSALEPLQPQPKALELGLVLGQACPLAHRLAAPGHHATHPGSRQTPWTRRREGSRTAAGGGGGGLSGSSGRARGCHGVRVVAAWRPGISCR